jgi:spermidine synthase
VLVGRVAAVNSPVKAPDSAAREARHRARHAPERLARSTWHVYGLLFASGVCALVYEAAWIRELRLVFGASTGASSAVLACFMGGLGLGGWLLGKRADRHGGSLRWYARLEVIAALTAAVTPLLIVVARSAYIAVGGTRVLGSAGGTAVRVLLSALVFAAPTFAMGGTLPAAARAIARREDGSRRSIALLYGANAAGAVVGCTVATFVTFEVFGTRTSLWLACATNLLIAGLAYRVPSWATDESDGPDPVAVVVLEPDRRPAPRALVLTACGLTGFVFCLLELVWYRMLGPLLGGSVFAFGLILAAALAGIAVGGSLYAVAHLRASATRLFAWTCLGEALAVAAPLACGDRIALVTAIVRPAFALGFTARAAQWGVIAIAIVGPAAIFAGVQFPVLIAMLGRGATRAGRDIGQAYACNTAGAIAGALAGGFGLIPALGAAFCWRLAAALLVVLGAASLLVHASSNRRAHGVVNPALLAVLAASLLVATRGPTAAWRHSPIGAGIVDPGRLRTPNDIRGWVLERRRAIDWEADGVESSIGIDSLSGVSFVVNGKNDGNARGDAATTVMLGLLGAFVHPHPRRSMVIGLGTGASAGWLAAIPSMTDVDVGELEPAVLEVARRSAPINHGAMSNPKVHIILGDARETLLTSRAKYDVIASEPSNPHRAGVASLFTREFYESVALRLEEGGIFLQWVQAYEVDAQTVRTVYATLASVFPQVESWHMKSDDLLLVASQDPLDWDVPRLRARMTEEPFQSAFALAWRTTELEGVLAHYVAGPRTARLVAEEERGEISTDDRNRVEFGFARCLAGNADFSVNDIRSEARRQRDDLPSLRGGEIDWRLADEQVIALLAEEGIPIARRGPEASPGLTRRIAALNAFQRNDLPRVVAEWRAQAQEPVGPTEVAIVATALADTGAEAALPYIDATRSFEPIEADVALARLRFRQGAVDDAMRALEAGFGGYRTDPWPMPSLMLRALSLSVEMLARYPRLAEPMWNALREPFGMRLADEVRKKVAAYAASILPPGAPCIEANHAFEPNPVWTEEFLESRARCYEATQDPSASRARGDVAEFLRLAPSRFSHTPTAPRAP